MIMCRRGGQVCPPHSQYIGETGMEAEERLRGDRGTITQLGQENTEDPVGVHFRAPGHSYADLSFIPIEKIRSRDTMVRKVRESYYIQKFNSVRSGLYYQQYLIVLIKFMYLTVLQMNSTPAVF